MRIPDEDIRSAVRFSFSSATTRKELETAAERIVHAVKGLESLGRY